MHLAGQIKMGYYPTPSVVIDQIKSLLKYPDKKFPVLDPCCGIGEALYHLTKNSKAITHGIELDGLRAKQARNYIHKFIQCDFLGESKISPESFSFILFNPPYDNDSLARRLEFRFFIKTIPLLAPEGVIAIIIPVESIINNDDFCQKIGFYLKNISVFPFPEKEFERFHQIVLLGIKRRRPEEQTYLENHELKKYVRSFVSKDGYLASSTMIDQNKLFTPRKPFNIPVLPQPRIFKSEAINIEIAKTLAASSNLWTSIVNTNLPQLDMGKPPLPFRKGHLALLLACGLLDGVVGSGDEKHVARGFVQKTIETTEEHAENATVTRETEKFQVMIKVLDQQGDITILR